MKVQYIKIDSIDPIEKKSLFFFNYIIIENKLKFNN